MLLSDCRNCFTQTMHVNGAALADVSFTSKGRTASLHIQYDQVAHLYYTAYSPLLLLQGILGYWLQRHAHRHCCIIECMIESGNPSHILSCHLRNNSYHPHREAVQTCPIHRPFQRHHLKPIKTSPYRFELILLSLDFLPDSATDTFRRKAQRYPSSKSIS